MKLAVIGLGTMGMGAALNLARHGHEVTGCEPRRDAWAELEAAGGRCVAAAAELPDGLEAALVLVVNARQAEAVLFGEGDGPGAIHRLRPGGVVVCSVTMAPEAARALA